MRERESERKRAVEASFAPGVMGIVARVVEG